MFVFVQSVIEAVRQINTDPARTPTALAVKILRGEGGLAYYIILGGPQT